MTERVDQPSQNPTRKLSAATWGAAFMGVLGLIVRNLAPEWFDVGVWAAMLPVVVFAFGYFVKDNDNSGLTPKAKEVGQQVDAFVPAEDVVIIKTPPDQPDIIVGGSAPK